MDKKTERELKAHVKAIAKILHAEAEPQELQTLGDIERSVRSLTQEHVTPEIGIFLSNNRQRVQREESDPSKVFLES